VSTDSLIAQQLPDHLFPEVEGFCHPDWEGITEKVDALGGQENPDDTWTAVVTRWLEKLQHSLEPGYRVHRTKNFHILTKAPEHIAKDIGDSSEDSLKTILHYLSGAASDEGDGPHVVLMFHEPTDYYQYISPFYPEGDVPMSGGVCVNRGYVHYAFPSFDHGGYRRVLAHEMTHACLNHLPIPTWLNEALAMRMETAATGDSIFHLDREIHERHGNHWNEKTIQQFWSGESWDIPGDSFELSYSLAEILWRKIEVDLQATREECVTFIDGADWADGGNEAFKKIFEIDLGVLASDFLGDGPWEPERLADPE